MPVNEVNITVDTRIMPDFKLVAAAYRTALERNNGQVGIFTLDCQKYDEYDALAAALGQAIDVIPQLLGHQIQTYNIAVHTEYGPNLWHTLIAKKPQAYELLFRKITSNPNSTIREYLTRTGNNPLRNHTYIAAIQGLTGVNVPSDLEQMHPNTWFLLQKVFTESYSANKAVGTPTIDNLCNNTMEIDRIKQETPEVWSALEAAIKNHNETRTETTVDERALVV